MEKTSFTVVLAFFANLAVAIAKTGAALLTGSASMVAEIAHSWADTGNEIFLLVAVRRGVQELGSAEGNGAFGVDYLVLGVSAAS